jgi:hypothetical protein
MNLLIFPNWSGEELHKSTISKLEGLAKSIEGKMPGHRYLKENFLCLRNQEQLKNITSN